WQIKFYDHGFGRTRNYFTGALQWRGKVDPARLVFFGVNHLADGHRKQEACEIQSRYNKDFVRTHVLPRVFKMESLVAKQHKEDKATEKKNPKKQRLFTLPCHQDDAKHSSFAPANTKGKIQCPLL